MRTQHLRRHVFAAVMVATMAMAGCNPAPDGGRAGATTAPTGTQPPAFAPQPADPGPPTPFLTPAKEPTGTPIPRVIEPNDLGELAVVRDGDIWIKSLPDGDLQRVTFDGVNRKPRWSPSGRWLAYLKEETLWVVQPTGAEARALGPEAAVADFAWSPVSDALVYTTRSGSLWLAGAPDWSEQELVSNPVGQEGAGVLSMAWSPDENWIAYVTAEKLKGSPPGQAAARDVGLWGLRLRDRRATYFFRPDPPAPYGLALAGWSQDSQYVLFWTIPAFSASLAADGVALMSIYIGGGLPFEVVPAMLPYPDFVAPDPSGTDRLAVVAGGLREAWTEKGLGIVRASTGEIITLTPPNLAVSSPAWSPDGQSIAFTALPDQGAETLLQGDLARAALMQRRLFVVDAQGRTQQLTDDPAYRDERPLWSADGRSLLFLRLNTEARLSLWLIPARGGEPRLVLAELSRDANGYGDYGHGNWDDLFDWWRPPMPKPTPTATPFPEAVYPAALPMSGAWAATAGCPNPGRAGGLRVWHAGRDCSRHVGRVVVGRPGADAQGHRSGAVAAAGSGRRADRPCAFELGENSPAGQRFALRSHHHLPLREPNYKVDLACRSRLPRVLRAAGRLPVSP